jgi:hypothetical protein
MKRIKFTKKTIFTLAVFLVTNKTMASNGPTLVPVVNPVDTFGKNLMAIYAMTPAQQTAAYPQYLKAAIDSAKLHNINALSDNFSYMRATNYDQAEADIFSPDGAFNYTKLTGYGFNQQDLFDVATRLRLAPSKAEDYSTGRLISTPAPLNPPSIYQQSYDTLQTAYANDPTLLSDLPQMLSTAKAELQGLSGSDLIAKQQEIQAITDFISANPSGPQINSGGSGISVLTDEQIGQIKIDQVQYDASIRGDIATVKATARSLQQALDDAASTYLDNIDEEKDLSSIELNFDTLRAQAEQFNDDNLGETIDIPQIVT